MNLPLDNRKEINAAFHKVTFIKGVVDIKSLPNDNLSEFAFVGRSNVGKSSLLNRLCFQNSLARTSNKAGKTKEINYFLVDKNFYLCDMPGIGYAKVSKSLSRKWTLLMYDYFKIRSQLKRTFFIIDARHGVKNTDLPLMQALHDFAQPFQIIFSKIDKSNKQILTEHIANTEKLMASYTSMLPEFLFTSAKKDMGFDELRKIIFTLNNNME